MRLLVTRPEPEAQRTASALRQRGHQVTVAPLLRIEPVAADLGPGPWDALVLTSANSCRASTQHPQRKELLALPVFVVGRRSAEAAHNAGFSDVTSADGDAGALAKLLQARFSGRDPRLLYLAGEDRAADLAEKLAAHGIALQTVVIYRAVKRAEFPPPARAVLANGEIDGVLHFSRRTAESYLSCATGAGILDRALAPFHYCLSAQVARPLVQAGAATVRVAARPDEAALLELVGAP
jgi:uroporphyrinogen-III synthase